MGDDLLEIIKSKKIIQGGMGVGVPRGLARKVSLLGQLGVASGVALEHIITRSLQEGDKEIRESVLEFPDQAYAQGVVKKYFISGGKLNKNKSYETIPFPSLQSDSEKNITLKLSLEKLIVLSTFAEINLAKRGHNNPVGINLLYEIEWPMMASLYGAMLAGVDAVLIGAGIPAPIPSVLDSLSQNKETKMPAKVISGKDYRYLFDPKNILEKPIPIKRPPFLAIVNGHLAANGVKEADGYVVEGLFPNYYKNPDEVKIPPAGGHIPKPRKDNRIIKKFNEIGEPSYGKKDYFDLEAFRSFLLKNSRARGKEIQPYWYAGSSANRLSQARSEGAQGVQVGTAFAVSKESAIPLHQKEAVIEKIIAGTLEVYTDPKVSPSTFPFNVVQLEGSLSDKEVCNARKKVCNIRHLIDPAETDKGKLITLCSAEPERDYEKKIKIIKDFDKIKFKETEGKGCLCNGLTSNVGYGNPNEPFISTLGKDFHVVRELALKRNGIYPASDVIDYVLSH